MTIFASHTIDAALDAFQVLIVPGRGNSGVSHWQTYLEASLPGARRVWQEEWDAPQLDAWAARIAASARAADKPVLVVAHSFGCLATVAALADHGAPIAGALLVAAADPVRFSIDDERLRHALQVPTTLVVSRNDPWLRFDKAHRLAARWNARVVDAGYVGHVNVDSGHGYWAPAQTLLGQLAAEVARIGSAGSARADQGVERHQQEEGKPDQRPLGEREAEELPRRVGANTAGLEERDQLSRPIHEFFPPGLIARTAAGARVVL
jgi:hypothetical protein